MAEQPIPNTIRLVLKASQHGDMRVNVLHAKAPGTVTSAEVDAAADALEDWVRDATVRNQWMGDVLFDSITAQDISIVPGGYMATRSLTGVTGAAGGNPAPGGTSAVVSLRTSLSGRSGKGRVYMYGLSVAHLDGNNGSLLSSTYVAMVAANFFTLLGNFTAAGLVLAVASRTLLVSNAVNTVTIDNKVDSQRRRLAGRGR